MALRVRGNPRFPPRSGRAALGGAQQASIQPLPLPAPDKGINLFDSLSSQGPQDAIYTYNMIPSEYGMRTRRGYKAWVTTLGGAANAVRTLIPFKDTDGGDKLWATTVLGIYDVTSSAASPAINTSFVTQTGNAGYGMSVVYNNDNGDFFVIYADEANGLYEFNVGAGTWAAKTDITGVNETVLVHVVEHKERLWFVEKDTMNAWYLATGAKGGAATKFNLGNKFPNGGHLVGIYKWSVDGGDGADDLLVFVSSAGDVAVYQGTDVSNANLWGIVGVWNIGRVPLARRSAENIGGELHLLSTFGLISMQDLVRGLDPSQITGQNTLARRITRAIRNDMVSYDDYYQWHVLPSLSEGSVIVIRPFASGATPIQYVFNFTMAGWGFWRGMPMNCAAEWNGALYFGDDVGNVHKVQDSLDAVARDGTGGDPVAFSFLSSYTDAGAPGQIKRAHYVRPRFFSENGVQPSYGVKVLYDYEINEPTFTLAAQSSSQATWDSGLWDNAVWGGESIVASRTIGVSGMGYLCAIAVRGEVSDRTTYLDATLYAEVGGMLL